MSQFIVTTEQKGLFGDRVRRQPRAKKAGALNAAQRTLKWLRDRGWTAEVVEKFIHAVEGKGQKSRFAGGYRKDLFGFCDVLAYRPDPVSVGGKLVCILAVQTTSRSQIAAHLRDYRDVKCYIGRGSEEQAEKRRKDHAELLARITRWINTPNAAFIIHGWEPLSVPTKKVGGSKVVWDLTDRIVIEKDLLEPEF